MKNFNQWLSESVSNDKFDHLFVTLGLDRENVEKLHIEELFSVVTLIGVPMSYYLKHIIDKILEYINTLIDDDDSRKGWKEETYLLDSLMQLYDIGDGSSYDVLFAAWIRDNQKYSYRLLYFLLIEFFKEIKYIKEVADKKMSAIHFHKYIKSLNTGECKDIKEFAHKYRGALIGKKFGL